ncbi:MAG: LPS export ABC transporter periplasmic protein LptC [Betaproteobacteria bacterium]|nr:LPS export ABC transporter periplasmic protein LptC [Betaproteobacteria bacterium]MDH3438276.1 LPS export ABC transporter periplasmic protein LptC [Betaproteobacteria bacterium]
MIGSRFTTWAPIVVLGVMAALTFWLDRVIESGARDIVGPSRSDPDFIVQNISAVSIGETGKAAHALTAVKMVHYPDDDSTLLTQPRFVSYGETKAPVTITANQGVVSSKGDHVYFQDNVRVARAPYGDQSELILRTSFLHVIPDADLAKTDRYVTIVDDATVVTAVGLELNISSHELKLLSNVRSTYDPTKAPPRGDRR